MANSADAPRDRLWLVVASVGLIADVRVFAVAVGLEICRQEEGGGAGRLSGVRQVYENPLYLQTDGRHPRANAHHCVSHCNMSSCAGNAALPCGKVSSSAVGWCGGGAEGAWWDWVWQQDWLSSPPAAWSTRGSVRSLGWGQMESQRLSYSLSPSGCHT